MTQMDGALPWERSGYVSPLTGATTSSDGLSVYTSQSFDEIIDPYLGALQGYLPPADRHSPSTFGALPLMNDTYDALAPAVLAAPSSIDDSYVLPLSGFAPSPLIAPTYHPLEIAPAGPAEAVIAIHPTAALDRPESQAPALARLMQSGEVAFRRDDAPPMHSWPPAGGMGRGDETRDFGGGDSPRPLHARSIEDRLSWWGSAVGGLALAGLVYERLLPFSGAVGFFIVYQMLRVALLVAVTALSHPIPVVYDRLATAALSLGQRVVFGALAWTIGFVIVRGWRTLHHAAFYTHTMAGVLPQSPVVHGGVLHALVGSGIELGIATIITLPLGIMTAVYMTEVGGRLALVVRTVIEAMTALPDLLAGLFIYTVLIIGLGFDRSGLAAALALSITMLPLVARSAEVALRVVPGGLRDAGVALGSTQWRTVLQVVLPTAAPGLATALIIAVARAVGETAPVLITSGASTFLNVNPLHNPMNSLPLFIYASLRSGEPNNIARGFGAAVLLLVVVLLFFALIRLVASRSVKTR